MDSLHLQPKRVQVAAWAARPRRLMGLSELLRPIIRSPLVEIGYALLGQNLGEI